MDIPCACHMEYPFFFYLFYMTRFLSFIWILWFTLAFDLAGQKTEKIYLSGTGYDDTVEWDFFCSDGMNSGEWTIISVPSQWELEGFGEYTYGRWYKERGKRPSTETGHYKTSFFAPETWKNRKITIVFEGVMTDTKVLINDKQAGEIHQGGFYRFKYDITDKVITGQKNTLEVFVSKHSEDRSVNAAERMADWWLFGGIYRPVYLEVHPGEYIRSVKMDPRADGSFQAEVELNELRSDAILRCSLKALNGQTFPSFEIKLENKTNHYSLSHKWDNVLSWTPETPRLYDVTLEIIRDGRIVHSLTERTGFRTIEVRPRDGIYCNGTKIILKGINRHTFWPESGRCTNKEISIMDAKLIKEMNMNAVRSHYPPDKHFLDACDSLGLFYIDELAGWQNAYRTEVGSKLVKEMVERDVNHPCIILWSNGNEGGWNEEVDPLFKELDPQKREVIHPWADFGDIDTHHYPQYQTGVHRFNDGYKIFLPTEFLHGLYDEGHGAGLEDFWAKWSSHPLFAGGFLWAFCDCAVVRSDKPGVLDSDGQNAPDGIVGPYREKEGSFYTVKEIWAPVQFDHVNITHSFNGEFFISNKYLYTNLDQCKMEFSLKTVPGPWDTNNKTEIIASGNIELPGIAPGEKSLVKMNLPSNFFDADILSISAFDPYGNEIYTWTWPVKYTDEFLGSRQSHTSKIGEAGFRTAENKVTVFASGTEVDFNTSTGYIEDIRTGSGQIRLFDGPVPVGMKAVADRHEVRMEGNLSVFTIWYKGGIDSIRWEMHPDGKLKMSMIALNKATNDGGFDGGFVADKIDLWGLSFSYPEDQAKELEWFGKGPYRVWKNRQKGTTYNLWKKEYNNTITGESFNNLVYPEFKGYHSNTYWASVTTGNGGKMTVVSESDGLFLRLLTPEEPSGALKRSLPVFPAGDISFLYEINPIHAFKPVSQMGPHSEPSSIRIKKGDEGISMILWFSFN